jgi:hypothetical protein
MTQTMQDSVSAPATTNPRRAIASFASYADAERAVDHLADKGFPVESVAIVGRGLKLVEQVTGRFSWVDAVVRGALTGAVAGVLVGWLFGLFNWFDPVVNALWLALDGLWFGALVGALLGLLMWLPMRGRRDFSSVTGMTAERYDLLVDEAVADQAARLLSPLTGLPTTSMTTT